MTTACLASLLKTAIETFRKLGLASARQDAEALMAAVLGCTRLYLYAHSESVLTSAQHRAFAGLCERRAHGEPLAYLVQNQDFCGLTFTCTSAVLIPRPETELLVHEACAHLQGLRQQQPGRPVRVLDIGTGSGCIALAVKTLCPFAEVDAWDVSPEALAVAKANATRLQASVHFRCVDARQERTWPRQPTYDLILSNPPYIGVEETAEMDQGVYDFEPHLALFARSAGLEFYQHFAQLAPQSLRPEGRLLLEVGYQQGAAVSELLAQQQWRVLAVLADFQGLDRVVVAVR